MYVVVVIKLLHIPTIDLWSRRKIGRLMVNIYQYTSDASRKDLHNMLKHFHSELMRPNSRPAIDAVISFSQSNSS